MTKCTTLSVCGMWCSLVASNAGADTLTLSSKVQAREQLCFMGQTHGYVAEFDGKEFSVYVLVRGCEGAKTLPNECTPYVVQADASLPSELASARDAQTIALKYNFKSTDVQMIEFNEHVDTACTERSIRPNRRQRLPEAVWVAPTIADDPGVVDAAALNSAGVEGQFVGLDWSSAVKDKKPAKVLDEWSVAWPKSWSASDVKPNQKIAVGGMLASREGELGYYFVDGVVKTVNQDGLVFTVTKIVETTSTSSQKSPSGPPTNLPGATLRPVKANVQRSSKAKFSWLGKLRALDDELRLDVQRLHSNGGRVVDIRASGTFEASQEVMWLLRTD